MTYPEIWGPYGEFPRRPEPREIPETIAKAEAPEGCAYVPRREYVLSWEDNGRPEQAVFSTAKAANLMADRLMERNLTFVFGIRQQAI